MFASVRCAFIAQWRILPLPGTPIGCCWFALEVVLFMGWFTAGGEIQRQQPFATVASLQAVLLGWGNQTGDRHNLSVVFLPLGIPHISNTVSFAEICGAEVQGGKGL